MNTNAHSSLADAFSLTLVLECDCKRLNNLPLVLNISSNPMSSLLEHYGKRKHYSHDATLVDTTSTVSGSVVDLLIMIKTCKPSGSKFKMKSKILVRSKIPYIVAGAAPCNFFQSCYMVNMSVVLLDE